MSRLRVGLLINPAAARGAAARIGRHVGHLLRVSGISVVDVSAPDARTARARALTVRDDLTGLVVVGGDGTVSLGAEIVGGTPVRLGIVPCGTGNDVARALGIPAGDPDLAVALLLRQLSQPVRAIDALQVCSTDDRTGPHLSLALGALSLGFDARVNARANGVRRAGRRSYVRAVLGELREFRSLRYWLEIDEGERVELESPLLIVANGGFIGGGMKLVPSARMDDGRLEIAWIDPMPRRRLLRLLPRVFTGSHQGLDEFHTVTARAVTVGLSDGAEQWGFADGEPRALLPLHAEVLPGAVRVLAGTSAPCLKEAE